MATSHRPEQPGHAQARGLTPSPPPAPAAPPLNLDQAQEMALKITTFFEGGKSMNYQALAGDFDGQGTSFGLIQWNFGQNTLGPLLRKMLLADATAFAACFGPNADYPSLQKALSDNKKDDQLAWARKLIKNNRAAWQDAFTKIGANDNFNRIQRNEAAAHYHPLVVAAIASIRPLAPDLMKAVDFRSYAALFDLCVQQNGIQKAFDAIKLRVKADKPKTQLDLMKIVVAERARVASTAWASDCMSRRLGILGGTTFTSTEHGIKKARSNPRFDLITQYGDAHVAGL